MIRLVGPLSGQEPGHGLHLPLQGDVIGGLAHDRPGVEGSALLDEDPGGVGPAVPGGVMKRRPAEPVGPAPGRSLCRGGGRRSRRTRPPPRRGGGKVRRRGWLRSCPALVSRRKSLRQALGRGQGEPHPPSLPALRHAGPLFEEKVDEVRLPAPGGELERVGPELVHGIDVRAGLDKEAARGRLAPLARAEDEGRPPIIVPRSRARLPVREERPRPPAGRSSRRYGAASWASASVASSFGALIDEKMDEVGVPAVSGVMEERHSLPRPGRRRAEATSRSWP